MRCCAKIFLIPNRINMHQITPDQKALLADRISQLIQEQAALQNKLQQQQTDGEKANTAMFLELLGVMDAIEYLCKYLGEHPEPPPNFQKRLPQTLRSILHKLEHTLGQQGVKEIPIASNEPPDFQVCTVVGPAERPDLIPETVALVSRRGFYQQERVLRPAEVLIAKPVENHET
jgi:molecular chaperone GrpE (heat shock protein)